MLRNLNNCFYCQGLGEKYQKIGRCAFCGGENPLYLVNYEGKPYYFCCSCAWWNNPHSEKEKKAEEKWHQERKKDYSDLQQKVIQRINNDTNKKPKPILINY